MNKNAHLMPFQRKRSGTDLAKARQQCLDLGLPNVFRVYQPGKHYKRRMVNGKRTGPVAQVYDAYSEGKIPGAPKYKKLAAELPRLEEALTRWEEAHQDAYRASPWFEQREAFKALRARGEVRWPEWWEILAVFERLNAAVVGVGGRVKNAKS